jgi:Protein of unknown function (DUF3108)
LHRRRLLTKARLLLAALALSATLSAQQPADLSPVSSAPYRVGEKLTYAVSFSNFNDAAHAATYVAGRGQYFGREGVELRAHVETVEIVRAALLALNSYQFSFVDPRTGLPYRARAQAATPAPPPELAEAAPPEDIVSIRTPPAAEAVAAGSDLLSALFRLRGLPLATGARFNFSAEYAGATYDAELRVTGRENVNTPAGSFNTLAAQVRVRNNDRADDYRIRIHFTDDERRVPVLITARLRAGELRAALASDETVLPAPTELTGATPTPQPTPATPTLPAADPARTRPRPVAPRPSPTPAAGVPKEAPAGLPFNVGEQLNFNFYLGNGAQPVGTASFQVRARALFFNRDGLLFNATMATAPALQNLFPVRDIFNTYVSSDTLLPFRSELQVQEGKHRVQGVVTYDQERSRAVATDGANLDIPVGTYDIISVLYALRSFDLTPPKRNAVSLLLNKRPRALFIESVARETIEVGGQRISAYQLALSTDEPQSRQLALRLWVGTDRRRLPLRLTAVTPLGPVRADLAILPLTRQ